MRRRVIPFALTLLILLGSLGGVFALETQEPHPAQEQIDRVCGLGYMSVDDEGDFRPDETLTRAMFVTLLGRLAGVDIEAWDCEYLSLIFTDVAEDAYFAPYLSWAVHTGVITGDGSRLFRPDEPITREQLAHCIATYLVEAGLELRLPSLEPIHVEKETKPEPSQKPENPALPETQLSVVNPDDRLSASRTEPTEAETEAETETGSEAETETTDYRHSMLYDMAERNSLSSARRQLIVERAPSLETEATLMGLFTDADEISEWAKVSVCLLSTHNILTGLENETGGMRFAPQQSVTRAEAAVIVCRLMDHVESKGELLQDPVSIVLSSSYLKLETGQQTNLVATVFPMNTANQTVIWYAEDPDIVAVDLQGRVYALAPGQTLIYAVSSNRLSQGCVVEVEGTALEEPEEVSEETEPVPEPTEAETEAEPEPTEAVTEPEETWTEPEETWTEPEETWTDPEETWSEAEETWTDPEPAYVEPLLGRADMTDLEKDLMVFGQEVYDPRLFYATDNDALLHQVVITVKTWDLAADGTKYTRTWGLQIHENIAATVEVIFEEIYNLEEKPVIHSMGGWRPNAGKSEHKPGLAIDINWLENFYCDPSGKAITGYYFRPGEDPYSIPVGGSIDQIFAKYGFTRGIYWRSGYKDYMHYSFYGT